MSKGSTAFRISENALSRELDGETVLVNLDTGMYFGLDEIGTVIWQHIQGGVACADIPQRLTEAFEVSEEVARKDLGVLLKELTDSGLLEPQES